MDRDPARPSTVVFDVGNTLHHIDHGFIAATISAQAQPISAPQVALAEYEAKAAIDARFRARNGGDDSSRQFSYFGTILEALDVAAVHHAAILEALAAENRRSSLWRIMHADTPQVLTRLQERGLTLAVVSNADGRVERALHDSGIGGFFKAIIDSHVVGVEKPDARIFELALKACGSQPAEALYVGDIYEIDVRGARNAGMDSVLLDPLGRYAGVDCRRIAGLAELLDLLPVSSNL